MAGYPTPIKNHEAVTSASFESEPPYDFGWAAHGSIMFRCNTWGNVDNQLVADVYWGIAEKGQVTTNPFITWERDPDLTKTISGSGGTTTPVSAMLSVPMMKSRFMKIVFTLSGTSKTVDINAWFYGHSSGTGGKVNPTHKIYQDFGTVTKGTVKASAGIIGYIRVTNANAAIRYFQLHNKASAPAATETPVESFLIPAGTATAPGILQLGVNELSDRYNLKTGIGWAMSTTGGTFTDSAIAGDHTVSVRYS